MKILKVVLLVAFGIVLLIIGIYIGCLTPTSGATEGVIMSASVPETEINRCVEILDKAGWINNHITVQF